MTSKQKVNVTFSYFLAPFRLVVVNLLAVGASNWLRPFTEELRDSQRNKEVRGFVLSVLPWLGIVSQRLWRF